MEYLIKPWDHQLEAITRARGKKCFGLWFEPGCGKTGTAINIWRERCNEARRMARTIIFCPPITLHNWKREYAMHSKTPQSAITILHGTGAKRCQSFKEKAFAEDGTKLNHVFVTNYESLSMEDLFKLIQKWEPEFVILDEVHRMKDRRGKRAKLANKICNPKDRKRPYVLALSGSPILNDPLDIFHQYKLLDGGETFGDSFMEFRARYYVDKNAGWKASQKYFPNFKLLGGATDAIGKLMDKYSMRVLKKDCLDLPDLVKERVFVEMTPSQRKHYKEMLRDLVTVVEQKGKEHVAVAPLALTKSLRLMQLASGYVGTDDGEEISVAGEWNPKQEALEEILTDISKDHKCLIWAVWKQNYAQIRAVLEKLKIKFVEVHGDVHDKQKFQNVDQFTNDPDTRVLLGHPGSGGIGINLVAASYAIFYSRSFSLEQDLQAEARNHRGGSEIHQKITRIDLVTKDSIEENIVEALANKLEISNDVLRQITLSLKERDK